MYKTRYSHANDFLDSDDVRAPMRRMKIREVLPDTPRRRMEILEPRALRLLKELPEQASLEYTAENFPHVVNRLAGVWNDAKLLKQYIGKLMIDDRGGRAGFPFEALDEIVRVRDYRLEQLTGMRSNA